MGPKSAAAKTIKVALAAGFLACVYSYFFPAASVIVPTTPTVNVTMAAQQVPIIELPNAKGVKIPAIGLGEFRCVMRLIGRITECAIGRYMAVQA